MFFSGSNEQSRNGVGIIFLVGMKENVINVSRSDRIMRIKLYLEETVNIVHMLLRRKRRRNVSGGI